MALNSNPSLLDSPQIIKRCFDGTNDSVRVNLGDINGLSVSLSAATGDSIINHPDNIAVKASLTSASTGVVIAATSCVGMKTFNLYTNTTATIVGAQACTLQVSPSDTDNVWIDTSLTVTESTVSGTVIAGTINSAIVARRCRVSIASTITSGTFDLYLVAQAV